MKCPGIVQHNELLGAQASAPLLPQKSLQIPFQTPPADPATYTILNHSSFQYLIRSITSKTILYKKYQLFNNMLLLLLWELLKVS